MKKVLSLACAVFLSLGAAACDDSSDSTPHVCQHFKYGYESHAENVYAGENSDTSKLLADTHVVYRLNLTPVSVGEYVGYISIAATEAGDLHFCITREQTRLSHVTGDKSTAISVKEIDGCDISIYQHDVHVDTAGTVIIKIEAKQDNALLLVEAGEHEHQD